MFVLEVSGIAFLSNLVHALAANLYLHPFVLRAYYGNMQGLIPCTLRRGKPIPKSRRVGTEIISDYRIDLPSQKLLILRRALINNTNGKLVIHLLKRNLFGHHLLIDRVNGFGSSLDVIIYFLLVQGCFHRFGELFDILELFLLGLFHFT